MIKALLETGGGQPIALLGLSAGNLDRLRAGQPILLDLSDIGLPAQQVVIMAGETEEAIVAEIGSTGIDIRQGGQ